MIDVSFYNKVSGKITRRATLDADMINLNALDGEGWTEGHFDKDLFYISGGVVTAISDADKDAAEIDAACNELMQMRNALLAASDWTQVPDAPVDQAAWATYRQALRDLPENTTDPRKPVWPSQPI